MTDLARIGNCALAALALLPVTAAADGVAIGQSVPSPDNKSYFYSEGAEGGNVRFFVYNGSLQKTVMLLEQFMRYPIQKAEWHDADLFELDVATGSPGIFALFYPVSKDRTSDPFWFPIAVDTTRELVAVAQERVYIARIFASETRFYPDLATKKTAITWLVIDREKTFFTSDGQLRIRYETNVGAWAEGALRVDASMLKTGAK